MEIKDAIDTIQELISGHECAIEAEENVVAGFLKYREIFNNKDEEKNDDVTRRVFQLLDSEKSIRNWKRQLEAFKSIIEKVQDEEG